MKKKRLLFFNKMPNDFFPLSYFFHLFQLNDLKIKMILQSITRERSNAVNNIKILTIKNH